MLFAPRSLLYRRVFPRFRPRSDLRPVAPPPASAVGIRIRWLGTAGFVVESADATIMIDPYLTRARIGALVTRPLVPDEAAIRARLPSRLDAVLCGHSHFDHLLDAPLIARITGAKLCGSRTTCAFGRANGVAHDRLVEIGPSGGSLSIGGMQIRFVPSLHARLFFGRVPFPGEIAAPSPAPAPARAWHYRMGGAFGILVRAAGVTVYHNGSADLIDANLAGERADVLLVGLAGRSATPDYLPRLVSLLQPAVVVPAHHDAFFTPLDEGPHLLPGIDLDGFVREIRRLRAAAQIITPLYDEPLWVSAAEGGALGYIAA